MNRGSMCLAGLILLAATFASGSWSAPTVSRGGAVQRAPKRASAVPRSESWLRLLTPPSAIAPKLPSGWKVGKEPSGFSPLPGIPGGGTYRPPISVDEMTREATLIAVGTRVGHDGSFYVSPRKHAQYTTYYFRVIGYLKDSTSRKVPYLKVLAPGGFLDGGEQTESPVPFLDQGARYLLYLIPNRGMIWGLHGKPTDQIGAGDEYWVLGRGIGRWWEDEGRLVGLVPAALHHGFPEGTRGPTFLSFSDGLKRVSAAVTREKRGIPYRPSQREDPEFLDPGK